MDDSSVVLNPQSAPSSRKRILVVDDHPLFRKGVVSVLGAEKDMEVAGEASFAEEALDLVRRIDFDLAVIDIQLPKCDGIELIKLIKAEKPSIVIVMLSMYSDTLHAARSIKAGARGYIPKADTAVDLVGALRQVLDGKLFLSPRLGETAILQAIQSIEEGRDSPLSRLTPRELEVLQLLGDGFDNRDIARQLALSVKTVETHRANAKEKLRCADAPELIKFATEWRAYEKEPVLLRDDAGVTRSAAQIERTPEVP